MDPERLDYLQSELNWALQDELLFASWFQDPEATAASAIMSFHNEIMFYITIIPTFVLIFIVHVIVYFSQSKNNINRNPSIEKYFWSLKHNTALEVG
jgi:heme/copper-type cytochrome/quinol oxidase subunit 2